MTKLLTAFLAAGWDPMQPSADCVAKTEPRLTPNTLSEEDRRGVHWVLLRLDLCRRFYPHISPKNPDEDSRALVYAATLHMMRVAGLPLDKSSFHAALKAVDTWERVVLTPAYERMEAARKLANTTEEVLQARVSLEPAWTLELTRNERGWIDLDGNISALQSALRQVEKRGVLPTHAGDVSVPDASEETLAWIMEHTSSRKKLSWVTTSKQIRLGNTELRDALEALVGAVEPVREARSEEADEPSLAAELVSESPPPSWLAEAKDLGEVVKVWAAARAARDTGDPHATAVLAKFQELITGDLSVTALAAELGLDPESLRRAQMRLWEDLLSRQAMD
ncbi:MAG: hypothetical protein JNK02_13630 [Planctomycetes bacterium]|nr:hypothetical protein [Planctomycetota bacterium]